MRARWKVVASAQVQNWYAGLDDRQARSIKPAIDALAAEGPALRRPSGGAIHGSRHRGMRELRSNGGNLRVLYKFDKRGRAVLLIGGDKTGNWKGWYKRAIRRGDRFYDRYTHARGGNARWTSLKTGRRLETGGR